MFHVSMYYLRAAAAAASKGEKYLFILAKAQLDGQDRRQQSANIEHHFYVWTPLLFAPIWYSKLLSICPCWWFSPIIGVADQQGWSPVPPILQHYCYMSCFTLTPGIDGAHLQIICRSDFVFLISCNIHSIQNTIQMWFCHLNISEILCKMHIIFFKKWLWFNLFNIFGIHPTPQTGLTQRFRFKHVVSYKSCMKPHRSKLWPSANLSWRFFQR